MGRRGQSPTQLVVDYFMNGELTAVEQALVIAGSIVSNRRARETSVALTAPARRPRVRNRKPAAVAPPAPTAAAETATATPQTPAAAAPRRRSRAAAAPADGAPRRRRGRPAGSGKTTGATPSLPSSGQPAAAAQEPPPLPDQGVGQGDE